MYVLIESWYGKKNQFDEKRYKEISTELKLFNDYIKEQSSSDIQQLLTSSFQNLQIFLQTFQKHKEWGWGAKWALDLRPVANQLFCDLDKIEEYYYKPLDNTNVEKDYTFPEWHDQFKAVTDQISRFVSAEVTNNKILQKPNAYIQAISLAMRSRQHIHDLDEMLNAFKNGEPVSNDKMLMLLDNINKDLQKVKNDLIAKKISKTSAKAAMWKEIVKKQCQLYVFMLEQIEKKHDGDTIIDEIKSDIEVIAEKVKRGSLYCLGNVNAFHTEEALKQRDENFDEELVEAYGIMRDKANDVDNKLILKFGMKLNIVRNAEPDEELHISEDLLPKKKTNKGQENSLFDDGISRIVDPSQQNVNNAEDVTVNKTAKREVSHKPLPRNTISGVETNKKTINLSGKSGRLYSKKRSVTKRKASVITNNSITSPDEHMIEDGRSSRYEDDDLDSMQVVIDDGNSLKSSSTSKSSGGFWSFFSWIPSIFSFLSGGKSLDSAVSDLKRSFESEPEEINRDYLNDAEIEIAITENRASSIGYRLGLIINSKGGFDESQVNENFKEEDLNELIKYSNNEFGKDRSPVQCKKLQDSINAIDEANGDRKGGVTKYGVIDRLIMAINCNKLEDSPVDDEAEMIVEQNKEKKDHVVITIEPQQQIVKEKQDDVINENEIVTQQNVSRNTTQHMQQFLGSNGNNHDAHIKQSSNGKSNTAVASGSNNGWWAYGGSWLRWGADQLLDVCCYGRTRRDHADDDEFIDSTYNQEVKTI